MKVVKVTRKNFAEIIKETTKSIRQGKVIVLPTDTVYGLICDATNKRAVKKLFKIKKRNKKKPLPIFVKDIKLAKKLAFINKKQEKIIRKSWPGKITVILKRKKGQELYGLDKNTIAVRISGHKLINSLFKTANAPLVQSSANISGKLASTKIKEIFAQFKNQKNQPDLIIDAGNLPKSRPSKVIDLTGKKMKILRK